MVVCIWYDKFGTSKIITSLVVLWEYMCFIVLCFLIFNTKWCLHWGISREEVNTPIWHCFPCKFYLQHLYVGLPPWKSWICPCFDPKWTILVLVRNYVLTSTHLCVFMCWTLMHAYVCRGSWTIASWMAATLWSPSVLVTRYKILRVSTSTAVCNIWFVIS